MGQYKDLVDRQRVMIEAEKWRKKVKLISGDIKPDRKLWTTTYNDDSQLFEKLQNGRWTSTTVGSKMTIQECIQEMGRQAQDVKYRK